MNPGLKNISRYCRIVAVTVLLCLAANHLQATHLMGGELTYRYDGDGPDGKFYTVNLIIYRYCDNTNGTPAPLDQSMLLGIYFNSLSGAPGSLDWYLTESIPLSYTEFVTASTANSNCSFQTTACIQKGVYNATIYLPDSISGYHLIVERCCRNGNIINLNNPGDAGMTFYAFVPPGIINSSPQLADVSAPYVCSGDTVTVVNNAYDPDGDSLVYSFVVPYNGYSSALDPVPDPQFSNNPYQLPIPDVTYASGYFQAQILGAGGSTFINSSSGLTKYFFPQQGFYAVAVEIKEYRNGLLISSTRRDLQFVSIACTPNSTPQISAAGNGGVYSVVEGQQICFNVSFNDADGDSLFLTASGPLLDPAVVIPAGFIADTKGLGAVSSQFCWTTTCGMSRPAPYQFTVTVNDNGCPEKSTSQVFSIFVEPVSASLVPTVSIAQDPPGTICQGSQVSFIASGTLVGTAPQYEWFVNGISTGVVDAIYISSGLTDGDIITVNVISNAACLFSNNGVSPPYVVSIDPQPAPVVDITSNPSSVLCPQQICLFTANVTNGGINPSYQWNINGSPTGTNQSIFTAANPAGIMSVYVTVNPATGCVAQNSDTITFNIQPFLSPEATITATATDSICPGQEVIFIAGSSQTGNTPIYSWSLNGSPLGITSDTLVLGNLNENDVVNVSVTSAYPCLSPSFAYAQPLEYHLYSPLTANLTDGPVELCTGERINLLMEAAGGNSSTYQFTWSNSTSLNGYNDFIPTLSGYYFATADDACYDPVSDSIYIGLLPVPVSDFTWSPEAPSVFFPDVQFTDQSYDAVTWIWNFGDGFTSDEQHPAHQFNVFGEIPVKLVTINDAGCTDTIVKLIDIEKIITGYLPNSFTPNGDGINDYFGPAGFLTGGHNMTIFNRWGQIIFSTSESELWNGNGDDGLPVPSGVYGYTVTFRDELPQRLRKGTLTLIR